METSMELGELASALAKVQATIKPAEKSAVNPQFKSKYSDLASIWDACRQELASNDLTIIQTFTDSDKENTVTVETMLLHKSGQYVKSHLPLPLQKFTAQGIGSAITYGRRYGLAAIVGVTPDDDDDGNAASEQKSMQRPDPQSQQRTAQPPTPSETQSPTHNTLAPEVAAARAAVLEYAQAANIKPGEFVRQKLNKKSSELKDEEWVSFAASLAEDDPFAGE